MDNFFIYDKPVTGKYFLGRKKECRVVANLLEAGENIALYDCPKSGKESHLPQSILNSTIATKRFRVCKLKALPILSLQQFLLRFGNCVIRATCSTPTEYAEIVKTLLPGTHFVFDRQRFSDANEVVSANWTLDENDLAQMLRLPGRIAEKKEEAVYMIIEEFQALAQLPEGNMILRNFKAMFSDRALSVHKCSFIFTGSRFNAMNEIFHRSPMFRGLVETVPLGRIDEMEIADYIRKGVNVSGKVIEKDSVLAVISRFDNQMWYINHFMSVCDSKTKGYFNNAIFLEALDALLAIHEVRFTNTMSNLTGHQTSLLKAILDGVSKFTASDVIRKYQLNSSANVSRVKEALMKKEIITFTEKDEPVIMDPLFRYWLENNFFR